MDFLDQEHSRRFYDLLHQSGEKIRKSVDYRTVMYIISANESFEKKVKPYLDLKFGMYHFPEMQEQAAFSHGEQILVDLSIHLFNDGQDVAINDLIRVLDDETFEIALKAIQYRKYPGNSNRYDDPGSDHLILR